MKTYNPRKHVAFVSSALAPANREVESFDFFAILLAGVVRNANQVGHRVSVFVPEREGETGSDQDKVLQKVLASAMEFEAIIIAPFNTDVVAEQLNEYFEGLNQTVRNKIARHDPSHLSRPAKPIVFIDKRIDRSRFIPDLPNGIVLTSVECANEDGGAYAGEILDTALRSAKGKRRFMVLSGLEGSAERVKGFSDYIAKRVPAEELIKPIDKHYLNFTRSGARSWMDREVERLVLGEENAFGGLADDVYWGIFACNDEMALGVHSVVSSRYRQLAELLGRKLPRFKDSEDREAYVRKRERDKLTFEFLRRIKIVGFDGIGPVMDMIKPNDINVAPDPWLIGTIAAEIRIQTIEAIRRIDQMAGRSTYHSTSEAKPIPVRAVSSVK